MEKSATTNNTSVTRGFVPASLPPVEPAERPPFYGWRYVKRVLPNGEEVLEEQLLTLEDVLHPQEGDVIPERPIHEQDRGYLAWAIRAKNAGRPGFLVLSDCLVDWGVGG